MSAFTLSDITPVILKIIEERSSGNLIGHDELVDALLSSRQLSTEVSSVASLMKMTERGAAGVILAQFSKQFTDANELPANIYRKRLSGRWAYSTSPH